MVNESDLHSSMDYHDWDCREFVVPEWHVQNGLLLPSAIVWNAFCSQNTSSDETILQSETWAWNVISSSPMALMWPVAPHVSGQLQRSEESQLLWKVKIVRVKFPSSVQVYLFG
jgi:hypothetical protein